jgi:hypothetical protein
MIRDCQASIRTKTVLIRPDPDALLRADVCEASLTPTESQHDQEDRSTLFGAGAIAAAVSTVVVGLTPIGRANAGFLAIAACVGPFAYIVVIEVVRGISRRLRRP